MADIQCPSCGKSNPETLEVCQFCGTLFKPAGTEPLDPILPGQFPERKKTAELERTLPGWLRNIRQAGQEPNTSPIQSINSSQEDAPALSPAQPPQDGKTPEALETPEAPLDLLAGLSQASDADEELPDWLKNLQDETPAATPGVQAEPQGSLDWLAELNAQPAETEPTPQPEAWGFSGEAGTFQFDENQDKEPVESFEDSPDWLAALKTRDLTPPQTPQPTSEETPAPAQADADQSPDWLASLSGYEPSSQLESEPSALDASLPGWLADLQNSAPVFAETASAADEAPAADVRSGDLPDWMSDLQSGALASDETPVQPAAVETPAGDLPDWMSDLQSGALASDETPVQPAAVEIPAGDLPDWMSDLQSGAPASDETPIQPAAVETPAGDLPDWMSDLQSGALASDETPVQPAAVETPAGDLPDWMSDLHLGAPASDETPIQPAAVETPAGDLPDWLAGAAVTAGVAALEPEETSALEAEALVEATLPDSEAPALETVSAEAQNLDSLLLDVPDWLSGFTPTPDEVAQPAEAAALEDADLHPVELPSWVQAMRPVESMLSREDAESPEDEIIEQHGPLAGFRSILPISAEAFEIRKPKTYALKLQVGETQREQAALLEKLLASESEPKPIAPSREVLLQRPLRWILFALFTLAVLIPAVLGSQYLSTPELPPEATAPFNQFYDTLTNFVPDEAIVLVVTDYQPGFAGELEQVAVPVLTHLMRKNARIAYLSTSPVSVEMGERLLQKGRAFYAQNGREAPTYLIGEQYLFLGYLPGGAAGIKSFAEQPQKATGIDSISGDLWQAEMLRDRVHRISDFAAVIVVTEDPDNGRLWIEQTDGHLEETPLLIVTSAQAGPMLQPYVASGQLNGLLVGLEDGALYEKRDAQPGDIYPGHIKALYWDGFGVALVVAVLAMFVGALWSLVERFRARKEIAEQDEA